jgi:CDP-diacylglycerol--glycerol-3-phosphate 3-phosphatidyltransferase
MLRHYSKAPSLTREWRRPTDWRIITVFPHRSQAIRLTIANLLSYLRLAAVPILLALAALNLRSAFLWLLAVAWATDMIDGPLARLQGQESARGAQLDSVADRALMFTIPLGVAWLWPDVLLREAVYVALLGIALVVPRAHAYAKFRRLPSYHTWLAKALAIYMAVTLLLLLNGYWPWLFRVGALVVLLEATEEIAITHTLQRWRADIPSWWHLRRE